ncbi:hypothetical protein EV361DRAFT_956249 [Lentinula raphanica]|nr:hypothetical protein EV361DRAFT_956249 [Lentinula raphanica]
MLIYQLSSSYSYRHSSILEQLIVHPNLKVGRRAQDVFTTLYTDWVHSPALPISAALATSTMFIGVFSSPLPLTPTNATSLVGRQEEQDLMARAWGRQYSSITMKLLRTNKQGKPIKVGSPVTKDEEWTLFLGPDGFRAHEGPGGTLVAETVKSEKDHTGHTLVSSKATQDLGEKAAFYTAASRDKAFDALLTDIPALHAGNGVPKTNLAYLKFSATNRLRRG